MKIFISQPMKGKTKEQIIEERKHIVETAKKRGDIIIDNALHDGDSSSKNAQLKFLAMNLESIANHADVVVFMKGYEEARGCKIEYLVCKEYGIRTMSEEEYCEMPSGIGM